MKYFLSIVLAIMMLAASPVTAQQATTMSRLGVNLEPVQDWSRSRPFINLAKQARDWSTADKPWGSPIAVDANGYPKGDFGGTFIVDTPKVAGVYRIQVKAKVREIRPVNTRGTVTNLRFENGWTTAEIELKGDQKQSLCLGFVGVEGPVEDIKVLQPGYISDEVVFTAEFLKSLNPFGHFRTMDFQETNNALWGKWADRPKVTDARWRGRGVPYEIILKLAEVSGKAPWICIPCNADDDHLNRLAALLREKVPAGRFVYIEFGNEMWNSQFKGFHQNIIAAEAEVKAKTVRYDEIDENNKYYWNWMRTAHMGVKFKKAFGVTDPRVRLTYATQYGFKPAGAQAEYAFRFVEKFHGPVKNFFWSESVAPYFGDDKTVMEKEGTSPETLAEHLYSRSSNTSPEKLAGWRNHAKSYGIRLDLYEAGVDMGQHKQNLVNKEKAQYLQRTGDAVEQHTDLFFKGDPQGDSVYTYFSHSGRSNWSGYWFLTDDVRDLTQPKYVGAVKTANRWRVAGGSGGEVPPPDVVVPPKMPKIESTRAGLDPSDPTKIRVTWDAVNGATFYRVYRDDQEIGDTTTPTFSAPAVTGGYSVKACARAGELAEWSRPGLVVNVVVDTTPPPDNSEIAVLKRKVSELELKLIAAQDQLGAAQADATAAKNDRDAALAKVANLEGLLADTKAKVREAIDAVFAGQ